MSSQVTGDTDFHSKAIFESVSRDKFTEEFTPDEKEGLLHQTFVTDLDETARLFLNDNPEWVVMCAGNFTGYGYEVHLMHKDDRGVKCKTRSLVHTRRHFSKSIKL